MSSVRKYGFDTVFSSTGEVLRDDKGRRSIYTEDEVEQVRKEAFAEGQRTELAKAEQAAAEAAGALARQAQLLIARLDAEAKSVRREALTLAFAAARASAGAALSHFGDERALAVAEEAFSHLRGAPRLVARIPEATGKSLEPRLRAAAADMGLGEAFAVRTDPKARPGDIALEWAEGRVGLSLAEIEARLSSFAAELLQEIEVQP